MQASIKEIQALMRKLRDAGEHYYYKVRFIYPSVPVLFFDFGESFYFPCATGSVDFLAENIRPVVTPELMRRGHHSVSLFEAAETLLNRGWTVDQLIMRVEDIITQLHAEETLLKLTRIYL